MYGTSANKSEKATTHEKEEDKDHKKTKNKLKQNNPKKKKPPQKKSISLMQKEEWQGETVCKMGWEMLDMQGL